MRKRGAWMGKATDPVLELVSEATYDRAIYLSKSDITKNILFQPGDQPGRSTIYREIVELEERGLLETHPEDDKMYRISEYGVSYLQGDYDASKATRSE